MIKMINTKMEILNLGLNSMSPLQIVIKAVSLLFAFFFYWMRDMKIFFYVADT